MPSYLTALGTALPPHRYPQATIAQFMADGMDLDESGRRRLMAIYRSTRIQYRHSVLADYGQPNGSYTFYPNTPDLEPFPTVADRMALYRREALPLAWQAVAHLQAQLPEAARALEGITHLITVSCTGLYAPGLDIELVERLGLPTTVQRTAINFMGCYGAFNGLKAADAFCRAYPEAKVLLVCVELCSIHFQKHGSDDTMRANALFADGAAAVLIEPQARGPVSLELTQFFCDLVPEGQTDMAWQVGNFGFEMVLSAYIPDLLKRGIGQLLDRLLTSARLRRDAVTYFAVHPGGRAILESIEQAAGLTADDNRFSYDVLRDCGNLSSCTVLFVLERIWRQLGPADHHKTILSCAFGPGLTLESALLRICTEGSMA
jgi:predicted naringenin-chalcone synthase